MIKKEDNLKTAPNSLIFVSLASMYLDNGMVDEAIDLCKSGLKIEPENEEAYLILAQAEIEKGNIDDAQKRLVELLERNPENAAAKGLLGQIEKHKKEEEEEKVEEGGEKREEENAEEAGEKREEENAEEAGEKREEKKVEEGGEKREEEKVEEGGEKREEEKVEEGGEKREEERAEEREGKREEPVEEEITEEDKRLEELLTSNIDDIIRIEGIINCFFRLKSGRIIKSANFVGKIDEVLPMLDSLLDAAKSSSQELNMGKVTLVLIEIEKGIFYIFASSDYDCFLISKNAENFGLVKAILPRILG